jgi:tetratricopeptide (TPR) repeat protein
VSSRDSRNTPAQPGATGAPATPAIARPLLPDPLPALLLVAAGVLIYAGTLHSGFVFDDVPSIRDNPLVRSLDNYLLDWSGYRQRLNRWVTYLTFALNYRWGGLDPTGYHAVNIAIHALNALLVFALVRLLFRTPVLRRSALLAWEAEIALVAALLFVAHPLQTQAVAYVVQRLASLATTFYLLAVVMYLWWRNARERGAARGARGALGYLAILATAALGMKTKETAFTAPLAALLCEVLFFEGPTRRRALHLAPLLATLLVIPLAMLHSDRPLAEVLADVTTVTRVQTEMPRLDYLATEVAVVGTYLRLLVFPVGQNVDYDYPLYRSFLEPGVLFPLFLHLAIAGGALWVLQATTTRSHGGLDPAARLVPFGVAWFYLALAVESSVVPIVDVIFEHRAYLPSVGAMVAAASGGALLLHRRAPARGRAALLAAGMACAGVLAVTAVSRNRVWASELTLWSDAARKSPAKSRPHNNLAAALADADRPAEALPHAVAAIRFDPYNAEAHYNLGRILLLEGRYPEAAGSLEHALQLRSDYPDAYANLAAALLRLGRAGDAVALLEGARTSIGDNPPALYNLCAGYVLLGDLHAAEAERGRLARLSPELAAQLDALILQRRGGPAR